MANWGGLTVGAGAGRGVGAIPDGLARRGVGMGYVVAVYVVPLQFLVCLIGMLMVMASIRLWPRNDGLRFRPEWLLFAILTFWAVGSPVIGVVTRLPWWFYTVISMTAGVVLIGSTLLAAQVMLRRGLRDLDEYAIAWVVPLASYAVLFVICAVLRYVVMRMEWIDPGSIGYPPKLLHLIPWA